MADEAFEHGEAASRAHGSIEITDAHERLARRASRKGRRGTGEDEKKDGRMRACVGRWLERVVRRVRGEGGLS